jgi:hypothetical protein
MKNHRPVISLSLLLVTFAGLAAEPAAPPASQATAAPKTPAPTAPTAAANSDQEAIAKAAHSLGYKAKQHEGKTFYCKSETKVGTNLPSTSCLSEDQVMATVKRSEGNRDTIEDLQRAFLAAAPDKFATDKGFRGH